ncbi:MAG: hypothetical protein HRU05_14850 [Oceanospirillaceae bacterium]|nr:hypothetical protein [Oceanospirillaceae bacterium]
MQHIKKYRLYIIAFIIILAIMTAITVDWKHLINVGVKPQTQSSANDSGSQYQISVYYFPSKENAAKALTYYFSQMGHFIEMYPASSLEELSAFRYSPNRMYFNHDEFTQAMKIKTSMEDVLGYPVNAYKFIVSQSSPSLMIVFTEGS